MKSIALMFMAFFLGVTAGLDLYHWTIAPQDREVGRIIGHTDALKCIEQHIEDTSAPHFAAVR